MKEQNYLTFFIVLLVTIKGTEGKIEITQSAKVLL